MNPTLMACLDVHTRVWYSTIVWLQPTAGTNPVFPARLLLLGSALMSSWLIAGAIMK